MRLHFLLTPILSILLIACSDSTEKLNEQYGPSQSRDRIVKAASPLASQYLSEVKPIIEKRCVVCHGCYDAPCQLKLSSPEGIDRGFSPDLVYATRFHEADPTRLFVDAQKSSEWRDLGYTAVLNERDQTPQANLEQSVIYHLLQQKVEHPLPTTQVLSNKDFDFSLSRSETCPDITKVNDYKKDQPLAGMPYGLPNLSNNEFNTLKTWIEQGAPMAQPNSPSLEIMKAVKRWESLFNQDNNKTQLISRYIYEHLFLGHLYFSDLTKTDKPITYFRLVRSSTPPGEKIKEIATRRPYDDPIVKQVYYRLRPVTSSIVSKIHIPYALNEQRFTRWNELFYQAPFSVTFLPNYDTGSNPFKTFAAIPADARYQFMLDEAEFSIMGFIKGPVCRGQIALNVIQDKFWVFFSKPEFIQNEKYANFIYHQADNLELPSDYSAKHSALKSWKTYAKREKAYVKAQQDILKQTQNAKQLIDINSLYSDASLTVFRNSDSATVINGLQGDAPKTAWIINYPILERIHYLLVAGYDVYGSIGHQLVTRLYMDFLRIEGEMSFITLLPKAQRLSTMEDWYLGATDDLTLYIKGNNFFLDQENNVNYKTDNPKKELFVTLKDKFKEDNKNIDVTDVPLSNINQLPNDAVQQLPPASFIIIEEEGQEDKLYTLLRHNAHSNVSTLLRESKTRLPKKDTAEVFKGLLTSYPQAIFKVSAQQQTQFSEDMAKIDSALAYQDFLTKYAIRRTNTDFWKISDRLHQTFQKQFPVEYGLIDYNRFENR